MLWRRWPLLLLERFFHLEFGTFFCLINPLLLFGTVSLQCAANSDLVSHNRNGLSGMVLLSCLGEVDFVALAFRLLVHYRLQAHTLLPGL